MPTPPKPVIVLEVENKSHRTKAELSARRDAEQDLQSGTAMREWPSVKKNPLAHKEYLRINRLLKKMEKNDALYQGVINRYCQLKAECEDLEIKREAFYQNISNMENAFTDKEKTLEYYQTIAKMQTQVINCDKQVMTKRKMMLDIEKENIMTIASALRTIPKKQEDTETDDPMARILGKRA